MASKSSINKSRETYKEAIEHYSELARQSIPLIEIEEASLKAALRNLPRVVSEDPLIKSVIFAMKDNARSAKKILRVIGRKSKIDGTSFVANNADTKLLSKMLRDQEHLMRQYRASLLKLLEGKIVMMKFAKERLGAKIPKGEVGMLEDRLAKERAKRLESIKLT